MLPLQIEFMVIPKGVRRNKSAVFDDEENEPYSDFDSDGQDLDNDDDDDDEKAIQIGSLDKRLKTVKHRRKEQIKGRETMMLQRQFYKNLNDLIQGQRSKRAVLVIDRRIKGNENDDEKIWMDEEEEKDYSNENDDDVDAVDELYAFLPENTQDIPQGDYLHESMCNLSRTEVLPSISGKIGEKDVIHTGSNSMEICLLSIHVHQEDVIRSYWCRNGTVSRFFLSDMVRIWPYHFVEKSYDDKAGIKYQDITKVHGLIESFGKELLVDKDFDDFCQINAHITDLPLQRKKKKSFKLGSK